ncbi:MAG: pentapeptide repeat-containing protein [Planctomycetota bacterium]|nr:pentapeptide repeat-containing protein [Planctomycetota bacterium]
MRVPATSHLVHSLVLVCATFSAWAADYPSIGRTVSSCESRRRGLRLEKLLQMGAATKRLQAGEFCQADLRGRRLLRRNRADRLTGATFKEACGSVARPQGKTLFTANLAAVRMLGVCGQGIDLHGAQLTHTDLHGGRLSGANLEWSGFSHARLAGADLSTSRMLGTRMFGVELRCATMSVADLRGAKLSGGYLAGAKFTAALRGGGGA